MYGADVTVPAMQRLFGSEAQNRSIAICGRDDSGLAYITLVGDNCSSQYLTVVVDGMLLRPVAEVVLDRAKGFFHFRP